MRSQIAWEELKFPNNLCFLGALLFRFETVLGLRINLFKFAIVPGFVCNILDPANILGCKYLLCLCGILVFP